MVVSASRSRIYIPRREIEELCRRYKVQRLALFGSVLREEFGPESDIDVLVSFAPEARVSFLTLSRMQRGLSALFQRHVDLVPMEGVKPVIREAVPADIEEVYAA